MNSDRGYLFCADLSLRQPGFAILKYDKDLGVELMATSVCKNPPKLSHGECVTRIAQHILELMGHIPKGSDISFVRERAFSRFPQETQTLNKVVGVTDYILASVLHEMDINIKPEDWVEIAPKTVKLIVAGSGNATKEDVAVAIQRYVGQVQFETDDESDAVAVGIAYFLGGDDAVAKPKPRKKKTKK